NAMVAVSLATAHAAAKNRDVELVEHLHEHWLGARSQSQPAPLPAFGQKPVLGGGQARLGQSLLLPLPMVNMISGGLHAGKNLDFQDFLILPVGAASFR